MAAARLSEAEVRRLARLVRLPRGVTRTPRRRRLALVAVGFAAALVVAIGVAAHWPAGLALGLFLGAALAGVRFSTEPQFVRFEALGLWPPPSTEPEPKA